jgi:hypothetical protein
MSCSRLPSDADIFAPRWRSEKPTATRESTIAAIVHFHGASVATRDVGYFKGYGLTFIDPWALSRSAHSHNRSSNNSPPRSP